MSADDTAPGYDPAGAFGAISNEIRIRIIEAFVEEQRRIREEGPATDMLDLVPTLSFSELQEAVGVEDSGKFNYHLNELVGRYVNRTEEGYQITYAGMEVAGSILAGGYGDIDVERQEIDRTCPSCGAAVEATYTMGVLILACSDSEDPILASGVPAGVFEGRSLDEAADVAMGVQRRIQEAVIDGYCPLCYGDVEMTVGPSTQQQFLTDTDYAFRGACDRCANVFLGPITMKTIQHPAAVSFFHDHGIDVRDRLSEEFEPLGQGDELIDEVQEDPLRLDVTYELDGDELRLRVDGDGEVLETERA